MILEVGDIGYQVFISPILLSEVRIGQGLELYTKQHVKEDGIELYGFQAPEELELFNALDSVSGVGPKSALGIISIANVAEIKQAISRGDPSVLTRVSGIGKKTAERIILELREKIADEVGVMAAAPGDSEIIEALVSLGYKASQARQAARQMPASAKTVSEKIKAALQLLGR